MLRYLIDEHRLHFVPRLRHQAPGLVVIGVGDSGAPPRGTSDPDLLLWCEAHDFVLVTADRRTMPRHLDAHISTGHASPGILVITESLGDEAVTLLVLAAGTIQPAELRDRLRYLRSL